MSKQRRTADDFVRDMKTKQQEHSTPRDIDRKTITGLTPEQAGAWHCPKRDRSRPERVAKT